MGDDAALVEVVESLEPGTRVLFEDLRSREFEPSTGDIARCLRREVIGGPHSVNFTAGGDVNFTWGSFLGRPLGPDRDPDGDGRPTDPWADAPLRVGFIEVVFGA
ncbi:MAG: hypothetical protein EXR76_10555 [Myxococcales bacterium]|nr:hypothetical protein [Myxococcales bacterium]